jgi:hypothetical protein
MLMMSLQPWIFDLHILDTKTSILLVKLTSNELNEKTQGFIGLE